MKQQIEESVKFIRSTTDTQPKGLVVIGTGLGKAIGELAEAVTIPYSNIPHFPTLTAPTHEGELIIGRFADYPLAVMKGRPHYYEGYSIKEVTYPLRVMQALGIDSMFITNAAGGLNVDYATGDIVIITDHINLMGTNPLRGITDEDHRSRFPAMSQAYDPHLTRLFEGACLESNIPFHKGVYVAVQGPSLETPAELRFMRSIGADLVGMSTVPEVIVAVWLGVKVVGISVVSNKAVYEPRKPKAETVEDINRSAARIAPKLAGVFKVFFNKLSEKGKK